MNFLYNILTHNIYKIIELILLSSLVPYVVLVMKLFNLIIPVLLLVCSYCIIIYIIEHKNILSEFKKIFNPGYTTKTRGWGLGLALAYRIVSDYHKGIIYVKESIQNINTTIRIELKK